MQGSAFQSPRRGVEFDVELGQFRHHQRILQPLQVRLVDGRRAILTIHQPGFQLEAADAGIHREALLLEPGFQQRGFLL